MSISLVGVAAGIMLPTAVLVAKSLMAKEIDKWLEESMDYIMTTLDSYEELEELIKQSSYDYVPYLQSYKTHYGINKNDFFVWEIHNERILAKVLKSDKDKFLQVISELQKITGKDLLENHVTIPLRHHSDEVDIPEKVGKQSIQRDGNTLTIEPGFMDKDRIIKVFEEYGMEHVVSEKQIVAEDQVLKLEFTLDSMKGNYILSITGKKDDVDILRLFEEVEMDYGRLSQEEAYSRIIEYCRENQYGDLQEEVLDDNSIVITVSI